jgi:hypothetical protein
MGFALSLSLGLTVLVQVANHLLYLLLVSGHAQECRQPVLELTGRYPAVAFFFFNTEFF